MTPMYGLVVAWGILTGILILLLIYKSTLTMHEDDSIFLNDTESQMQKDQAIKPGQDEEDRTDHQSARRLSGAMLLVIAGLFVYHGLNSATTLQ